LPPFTKWKKAADYNYNVSLLQRLAQRPGVPADHNLMVVQYRMHPSIATIVSDIFYGGRLTTAPTVIAARHRKVPVHFIDVAGSEQCHGTSFRNIQEARRVVEIVHKETVHPGNNTSMGRYGSMRDGELSVASHAHALSRTSPLSIDVIAFHKPQVLAIKEALERSGLSKLGKIDVTTVDSMQGRCVAQLCCPLCPG
jgi:superfamily I DNA and/or RNA helicase